MRQEAGRRNKGITAITYNQLHLPQVVTTNKGTIAYTYDMAGNKLQKVVAETGHPTQTTLYGAGGAVYENDVLQCIGHQEGRIRPVRNSSGSVVSYACDYLMKDHLGNVRTVLTDEQQQDN